MSLGQCSCLDGNHTFSCLFSREYWACFWEELNLLHNPLFWMAVGLLGLWFLLKVIGHFRHHLIRVYTTNRGMVYVKRSALKNVVKKICATLIPNSKARVKIHCCWRKIHIRVAIACPHDAQPVSIQLQQTLFRVLQQEVGICNLGKINVVVERIVGPIRTKFLSEEALSSENFADFTANKKCCSKEKCTKKVSLDRACTCNGEKTSGPKHVSGEYEVHTPKVTPISMATADSKHPTNTSNVTTSEPLQSTSSFNSKTSSATNTTRAFSEPTSTFDATNIPEFQEIPIQGEDHLFEQEETSHSEEANEKAWDFENETLSDSNDLTDKDEVSTKFDTGDSDWGWNSQNSDNEEESKK